MQSSPERPDISKFENPNAFVDAMLRWRRASDKKFNVSTYIKKFGCCSPSLVYLIAQGRRRLTGDHTKSFAKLLGLDPRESSYFEKWVMLTRSQSKQGSKYSSKPMRALPERKPKNHLLKEWVHIYVKESVNHKDFEEDPEVISKILNGLASPQEIESSLKFLISEEFLIRNKEGKLVLAEEVSTTTKSVPDENIRKFHKKVFDLAKNTLLSCPLEERSTSTFVFC